MNFTPCLPRSRSSRRLHPRKGAVSVEFAIVGPILFITILALFQFAGLLMNQNILSCIAREAARHGSLAKTESSSDVEELIISRLTAAGIAPEKVEVDVAPTQFDAMASGERITISLAGKVTDMIWIGPLLPTNAKIKAKFTSVRE